jgi:hypothetical protein
MRSSPGARAPPRVAERRVLIHVAPSEESRMNDQLILLRVHRLDIEERALRAAAPTAGTGARLLQIEVELERCWELLSHEHTRAGGSQRATAPDAASV